ncbi:DUF7269 family protein [Natrinema pallidum]|uniref:Uncharacterized protein n=1 Tax=Natrinema pallidum DSM 3751 TaxID=1227495 RepID=L9ZDU6_9EURY|nr:hypothetical protein [Natrinema pallidum]ELY83348.1 hypothetical protein C487_00620 [Natrinema pallidum DSM 3751]
MSRRRQRLVSLCGVALVAIGTIVGVGTPNGSGDAVGLVALLTLVALGLGLWTVRGSLDTTADAPAVPWAADEPFANPAPERTDRDPALSSDAFAGVIETACETARDSGTVDDGIEVVRSPLRTALLDALEQGGRPRSAAEEALADGNWTGDRVVASVLAPEIEPPPRPLRERVRAWLYPERVVRRRARRATNAVAEAADDALPTVPGQTAPRAVPMLEPSLEDLQRGADGRLQRAVEPRATARGPQPVRPRVGNDRDRVAGERADGDGTDADRTDEPRDGNPEVTDA